MEEFSVPDLYYAGRTFEPPAVFDNGGPDRVVTDQPAPDDWRPRPLLAFRAAPRNVEPLLWKGDYS